MFLVAPKSDSSTGTWTDSPADQVRPGTQVNDLSGNGGARFSWSFSCMVGCMRGRLFIVGQEEPVLFAMSEYFRDRGYEVSCTNCVPETAALPTPVTDSVVILDLPSQPMDQVAALEFVKQVRAKVGAPVLLLSPYPAREMEPQARRLGIAAFVQKPQPLAEIDKIVRKIGRNAA